jgi:hypothetical protein
MTDRCLLAAQNKRPVPVLEICGGEIDGVDLEFRNKVE